MLKKLIALLLTIGMLLTLSACGDAKTDSTLDEESKPVSTESEVQTDNTSEPSHTHTFADATCVSPKTCSCGTTEGNALGHTFTDATCVSPKTCTVCGATEGNALGHNYVDGTCSVCKQDDPNATAVGLEKLTVIDAPQLWSRGYSFINSNIEDNFKNTYDKWHRYSFFRDVPSTAVHDLGGKYSTFTGSIVATRYTDKSCSYTVKIYVDDVLKFTKTGYTKPTGKVDFSVDVKGGTKLTIEAFCEQTVEIDHSIGIVDAVLTK